MRRLLTSILLLSLIACDPSAMDPPPETMIPDVPPDTTPAPMTLRVMTFNVLCSFCGGDAYDPWSARLAYFEDLFARHDPDLVGLQELFTPDEVEALLTGTPGYEALFFEGIPGPLMLDFYPDAAILYRADRFTVVESGFYWLSETPDEPWSAGWAESNLPRLVAWVQLRQVEDGRELYFATTHFDNNPPNQDMSAPLFVERSRARAAELPVILTGDFNSQPVDPAYATLTADAGELTLRNAFELSEVWLVDHNQAEEPAWDPSHRIDHIFVVGDGSWRVPTWSVDLHVYGPERRYPSDHFAVVAEIAL
ncbi:MAG: endonuclease/exonuclease/phosphatase family protein [Pseudomonadota bacterium]